jgi:hypothetical protein
MAWLRIFQLCWQRMVYEVAYRSTGLCLILYLECSAHQRHLTFAPRARQSFSFHNYKEAAPAALEQLPSRFKPDLSRFYGK